MKMEQNHLNKEAKSKYEDHTFSLSRISKRKKCPIIEVQYFPTNTAASSSILPSSQSHKRLFVPTFNNDSSFYTPAFVLRGDQAKYESRASKYLSLHENMKAQICLEKSELYVPKLSETSNPCSVCKSDYEDYLTHINGQSHKQMIKCSNFNASIHELCGLLKKESTEVLSKRGRKKSKKISKNDKNTKHKAQSTKHKAKKVSNLLSRQVSRHDCSVQAKTREFAA